MTQQEPKTTRVRKLKAAGLGVGAIGAGLLLSACFGPGTIATQIGNGTAGYTGDGGKASAATLHSPQAVAVDASGNAYVADTTNCVIREYTKSTGNISTVAGNGTCWLRRRGRRRHERRAQPPRRRRPRHRRQPLHRRRGQPPHPGRHPQLRHSSPRTPARRWAQPTATASRPPSSTVRSAWRSTPRRTCTWPTARTTPSARSTTRRASSPPSPGRSACRATPATAGRPRAPRSTTPRPSPSTSSTRSSSPTPATAACAGSTLAAA